MRQHILATALSLLGAVSAGTISVACPLQRQASGALVVADNAATSTPAPSGTAPNAVAYPNSPNGSPVVGNKGAPVVTDRASCTGTGPTATCDGSPAPSGKADTSDTSVATPTTVNAGPKAP